MVAASARICKGAQDAACQQPLCCPAGNRSGKPLTPARRGNTLGNDVPPSTGAGTYNSAARRY